MDRTAIVTGASRGLGHATALALAEEGFDIAAVDLLDVSQEGDDRRFEVHARGPFIWTHSVACAMAAAPPPAGGDAVHGRPEVRVDGGLLLGRC